MLVASFSGRGFLFSAIKVYLLILKCDFKNVIGKLYTVFTV